MSTMFLGVGTTAQCLKAGKPQIVIPFCMDQFDNGYRIQRLGCGEVIEKKHLNQKKLTTMIKKVIIDEKLKQNCKNAKQSLELENGIENVTNAILSCF